MNEIQSTTTTTGTQPTHAVRRVRTYKRILTRQRFDYLATGSREECESLVKAFSIYRRIYGDDLEPGETGPPVEETVTISEVPASVLPVVIGRAAARMDEANRAKLADAAEQFPEWAKFINAA